MSDMSDNFNNNIIDFHVKILENHTFKANFCLSNINFVLLVVYRNTENTKHINDRTM